MTRFFSLAALLLAAAGFSACSSDSDTVIDQPEVTPAPKTYSVSIDAAKGDDGSINRALSLDGDNLTSAWAENEEVTVYNTTKGEALEGKLTAQAAGANTTLAGTLTGNITAGDELLLKFCSDSYNSQNGTLAYISQNCDYATATVTVDNVTESAFYVAGSANFENHQAILRFTLKDKSTSETINPTAFTISDGDTELSLTIPASTYTTNGDGVLYVAFPAAGEAKTITLTATVGETTYTKEVANITFSNANYYPITVNMSVGPNANGHEYVDLGITNANGEKLLWAKMNVGADSETAYGDFFQWGGTTAVTNSACTWTTYSKNTGFSNSSGTIQHYTGSDEGYGSQLQPAHDVARVKWGGDWVMPTSADFDALMEAYPFKGASGSKRSAWATVNNVNGLAFYAADGTRLLFLPAASRRGYSTTNRQGELGYYWTSELFTSNTQHAYYHYFDAEQVAAASRSYRYYGLSVRPVLRYTE